MTRFRRAYLSHNRLEWWYGHLAVALSRHLNVVECPMMRFNQAGHAVETNLCDLVDGTDTEHAFYLGSCDQLFAGVADVPLRSAIWSDYYPDSKHELPTYLSLFDVVFHTQKNLASRLERAGIRQVEWLPFAFDTTLWNERASEELYDVGFVGSLELPATRAERLEVLGRLGRSYRLNDYRTPVFGDDMMRVYNASRIVVNIPWPGGLNMRTFEALASGALLLTKDIRNGQDDLFKSGTHLVMYRDTADLIDKIDYYLANERERREIAGAGRREVLAHHTYDHRAARVLDMMAHASHARTRDRASRLAAYGAFYDYLGRADLLAAVALDRGVPPLERLRLLTRAAVRCGRFVIDFRQRGGVTPARSQRVQ